MDWTEMATDWVDLAESMEATLAPVLARMIEVAALEPGSHVLDIGFGTGDSLLAALSALGPEGRITGYDIAPQMVSRASERVDDRVELHIGDAQSLPFEANAFDAVISKFGTMFFDDTEAAFANIRSGVRSGGKMTLAAWGSRYENPYFSTPARVAQTRLGKAPPPPPDAPGPLRFEDADAVIGLLERAGWADAAVLTETVHLSPQGSVEDLAAIQMRIGSANRVMEDLQASLEDRDAIQAGLAEAFSVFEGSEGLRIPAQIHFFTARA